MTELQRCGVEQIRGRLAAAIRDSVLGVINSPKSYNTWQNLPEGGLSIIAGFTDEQRKSLAHVFAVFLDAGMRQFLHGLDNEPDGIEISFEGTQLNKDGRYLLSSDSVRSFEEMSSFDGQGRSRKSS